MNRGVNHDLCILENDVSKWQKKCMEAERDLKEEQRLEKTPSGKDMYSSTLSHSRYVCFTYIATLYRVIF